MGRAWSKSATSNESEVLVSRLPMLAAVTNNASVCRPAMAPRSLLNTARNAEL